MSDENTTKNEDENQDKGTAPDNDKPTGNGESGNNAGADSGSANAAGEQGVSYEMLMETLSAVQANQAKMSAQIQKLTDAQSVLVDAGAVVREGSSDNFTNVTDDNVDGFVSIDELDLNI